MESGCLFRPLRFNFMHCGVIRGPLQFDFWLLNVRPYNRFSKSDCENSIFLDEKNPIFLYKKNPIFFDGKNPIFLDEKNPIFLDGKNPIFLIGKNPIFFLRKKSDFLGE